LGKDFEGGDRDLIEALSGYFSEGTEENQEKIG
jgi:hypothetical protein